MIKGLPKVLVASPTARAKAYCFDEWLKNTMALKYPNFDVRLYDNSPSGKGFTKEMNVLFKQNFGEQNQTFKAVYWDEIANNKNSVMARMARCHQMAAEETLKGGYEYLLHLESDVFVDDNVIEKLIFHGKSIVGGLYHRDSGLNRRLMVQIAIKEAPDRIFGDNLEPAEERFFADGTLKEVSHIGLGCMLIHRSVLAQIPFKYDAKRDVHPDTIWAEDVARAGLKIYADTSIICRHDNEAWGQFGWHFK